MNARLAIVSLVAVAWTGGLTARLCDLQIRRHEEFLLKATGQQERVRELTPPRGTIYDRRGRELAVSVEVESAFAVPKEVQDPLETARRLGEVLDIDVERLAARLAEAREFVWVARKLDRPVAEKVRKLGLSGIDFLPESKRYYPMGRLAAQVIGFVGTDHRGLAGLEARYDRWIAGRPGRRTVLRDARRGTLLYPGLSFVEAEPGQDIYLTLDASIQLIVERELARTVDRYGARRGTAVVVDPQSGAILAMATYPGFDPNHFNDYSEASWRNANVMDADEPGSTLKLFTAAAVLEPGLLGLDDELDCGMGGIDLGAVTIRDHSPFGLLTLADVIIHSSNVGAVKMGLLAGEVVLHGTLEDFGFGEPTGVDLPGENPGILKPLERWTPLTKAYISFGQEISVTPLQLARAVAAVANGGHLMRPYVVDSVRSGGRRLRLRAAAVVERRAISERTARVLTRLARAVVERGSGRAAAVAGYAVAGKTGTAQKAVGGRYSSTRHVASFAGFAPAHAPRIVCLVTVDGPRGAIYGGQVAAPAFSAMAEPILLYLGVPPQRQLPERWPGETSPEAEVAPRLRATLDDLSPGTEPQEARLREEPPLRPPAAEAGLPDFDGVTARQVLLWASARGVRLRMHGHGWVYRQAPAPGTTMDSSRPLEVWLRVGAA